MHGVELSANFVGIFWDVVVLSYFLFPMGLLVSTFERLLSNSVGDVVEISDFQVLLPKYRICNQQRDHFRTEITVHKLRRLNN